MKTLLILRHAKSSWRDPGLLDHDRPLNKRGLKSAPLMGQLLRDQGLTPDVILSSTAVRAKHTAELAAKHCGFQGKMHFLDDLYAASATTIMRFVRQLPDELETAMVVGHNPGLEELASLLTKEATTLPTAALAQIELPVASWSMIVPQGTARRVALWLPRELE